MFIRSTVHTSRTVIQLLLFLVNCLLFLEASSSETPQSIGGDQSGGRTVVRRAVSECQAVSDIFAGSKSIGGDLVIPANKLHGHSLDICNVTSNGTCCTRQLEGKLLQLAVKQTQDVVTNSSSELKSSLASNARLCHDHFNEFVSLSENNTRNVLTSTFKIPTESANSSVEKLFNSLETFIKTGDQVNVRQSVSQFFDAIFPWVVISTREDSSTVTDAYRICLMNSRKDLTPPPFGDTAKRLEQDVAKSLEVGRALLDALDLAAEAVQATDHLAYERHCSQAITRLVYCSSCHGYAVRPCKNFCLNVMRGCMAHVTEVHTPWTLFVDAIEKLIVSMRDNYDFQNVFNTFHSKVSESIMHYLSNAPKYNLQVIGKCGSPMSEVTAESGRDVSTEAPEAVTADQGRPLLEDFPMKKLRKFNYNAIVRSITASKSFFSKLPDNVCGSENFVTTDNVNCWNGTNVNRYSRPVSAMALTTQVAENAELNVSADLVPEVVRLIEKLNQMTKTLHNRVIPRLPLPMMDLAPENSGFDGLFSGGSGRYPGFTDDEDDYDDGSTSGSGTETPEPKLRANSTDTTDFDFLMNSTSSTTQQSVYKTGTRLSASFDSTTTTSVGIIAKTTGHKPAPPPGSATMTSVSFFFPILAFMIQRICCCA